MDEAALEARVDPPVATFDRTPNTSEWVRRRGHDGAPAGAMAVANELTAAHGRAGSSWSAPPGGVWCSILLRPGLDAASVGRVTVAGGLAVLDAVRALGVDADLKWPNDVVVRRDGEARKLAGVLTEPVVDGVPVPGKPVDEVLPGGDPEFVVLGVGLNADLDPGDLDAARPVTTLRAEVGDVDRLAVTATLHERVLARTDAVATAGEFDRLLADYRSACGTLGERVRVDRRGDDPVEGEAVGLTGAGALRVETGDGEVAVTEGDCRRLRRS